MSEEFEDHLGELMDYRVQRPAAPFTPDGLSRAALRRRNRSRALGVTASVLAVTAVGVGAAALGGHPARPGAAVAAAASGTATAPTTDPASAPASPPASGTATAPSAPSPVVTLDPGHRIDVGSGMGFWVTDTKKCVSFGPEATGPASNKPWDQCFDETKFAHNVQEAYVQGAYEGSPGRPTSALITGMYFGPTVPARISVEADGHHADATIVTTAGMRGWVGFYALLHTDVTPTTAASPGSALASTPLEQHVTVYDAAGKVLYDGTGLHEYPASMLTPPTP